jgi:uncharacterized membrane protein YesL
LRVIGAAITQVLTHVSASLLANLVGAALSAPLVVVLGIVAFGTQSFSLVPLGVALLVGVLPNPAMAGVQTVAHELATEGFVTFHDHWEGVQRYARPAARLWLVSLAGTALILGNLAFYAHAVGTNGGVLRVVAPPLFLVWLLVGVWWISMHLYVFPMLIKQEVKTVRLVYRNAALMTFARPSMSIVVTPIWVLLLLVSSTTGLATFIGLALCASIQQNATARMLPMFRSSGET